jgi:putative hydrolase of the HAD superfamily
MELTDAEADERYQVFIREYEQQTRAYDDAAPCLEKLVATQAKMRLEPALSAFEGWGADLRLGIISNGARQQQLGKLRRAGLLEFFTVTVFSEDTGLGKPHPSIFQEACRRAGKAPSECFHVGDDLTNDIYASHALGICPIWIDRIGNKATTVPARRITSLAELVETLEERAGYARQKQDTSPQVQQSRTEEMPQRYLS